MPGPAAMPAGPVPPPTPGPAIGPEVPALTTPFVAGGSGAFVEPGVATIEPGFSPNLGGFTGAAASPPGLVGDFQPISQVRVHRSATGPISTRFPNLPSPLPPRTAPGGETGNFSPGGTASVLYKLTGLKVADNMSPRPQDRVFYSFNYFDNVNASVNGRNGIPVSNLQIYHSLFGLEKTFLDGRASVGVRVPLNTFTLKSTVPGVGGSTTSLGDLSIFTKYALYSDDRGNLVSIGVQVTPPTGPGAFAGNRAYQNFRDTQIQPFVGYIFARDRFFVQGFSSVNVPTTARDVTLLFNDLAIGYYVYRAEDPTSLVSAIVPLAEAHVTTPLNHRGTNPNDLASISDIVNMTVGTNLVLRNRAILTAAYVTPVTGPKPFNAELVLLFNLKFGGSARSRLPGLPIAQ